MKSTYQLLTTALLLLTACTVAAFPGHPRLLVTETDWENLPARMEAEPVVGKIVATVIARADTVLDLPPLTREVTGRRLLGVSRDALQRVLDLSTAWKVSGERKYYDRCREELLAVCSFKDWNPVHHLDTAEMQTAVAIGYDWLYHELSPADRKTITTALLEKGLKSSLERDDIARRHNNWNQVCMGGMVLSAVALMDVEKETAERALAMAKKAIPTGLKGSYPPDGAYAEGGGYWNYGTEFSVLAAEALRTANLPDAGITSHPGFLESGNYIAQVYGTSGLLFNYGDTSERPFGASPAAAWIARESRSATLRDLILPPFGEVAPGNSGRLLALCAFWFPLADDVREQKTLAHHYRGSGYSPIVIHRTGFANDDLFLGIKAGKADVNHGHMDAGSFVLDWAGKRWASDIGKQDYHPLEETGMNLFEMTQNSRRWTVFRLNNLSHNTLTYNGRFHDVNKAAAILKTEGGANPYSLLDIAPPLGLPNGATATRRFEMEDISYVTITDKLQGLNPGDTITWNLITPAKSSPTDGGFNLILDDERLTLRLSSPQTVSATTTPADPPNAFDEPNPGLTRIILETKAGEDGDILIEAAFVPNE